MRDLVTHLATGITLDLSAPDYGHPDGPDIVRSLYGHLGRKDPQLVCAEHGSPLYLQMRSVRAGSDKKQMWGIHFDGRRCSTSSVMSDEHKRQTEYVVRAAEDAGYTTATEVPLPTRVRPDAVIYGRQPVAIEVQRSHLTRRAAVGRTTKAVRGGMSTSVWISDRESTNPPGWFWAVPSVGMNNLPWDVLPAPRSATATTGVREIVAKRCQLPDVSRCPKTKQRPCGDYHPFHQPWHGLTVDDVATMTPDGQIAPLRFMGREIILVSPKSRSVYEELTGRPSELWIHPSSQTVQGREVAETGRVECTTDNPGAALTCCGTHQPGVAGGPLVPACQLCPESPTYWRRTKRLRGAGPDAWTIDRLIEEG